MSDVAWTRSAKPKLAGLPRALHRDRVLDSDREAPDRQRQVHGHPEGLAPRTVHIGSSSGDRVAPLVYADALGLRTAVSRSAINTLSEGHPFPLAAPARHRGSPRDSGWSATVRSHERLTPATGSKRSPGCAVLPASGSAGSVPRVLERRGGRSDAPSPSGGVPAAVPRSARLRRRHLPGRDRDDRPGLRRDGLGTWVAALLVADFLPIVVIGLTLGPLIDRLPRKRLMIGAGRRPVRRLRRAAVRRGTRRGGRARSRRPGSRPASSVPPSTRASRTSSTTRT